MTLRPLAALGCRLLAIYAVLLAFSSQYLGGQLGMLLGLNNPSGSTTTARPLQSILLIAVVAPPLALLIAAALLWTLADAVAYFMVRERRMDFPAPLLRHDWQALLFSSLGLFLVLTGIEGAVGSATYGLLYWVDYASRPASRGGLSLVMMSYPIAGTLSSCLRLIIGLWLLLRSRHLVRRLEPSPDAAPEQP